MLKKINLFLLFTRRHSDMSVIGNSRKNGLVLSRKSARSPICLGLLAIVILSVGIQAQAQNGPPPAVVQVAAVRSVPITEMTIVPGTVISRDAATLAAEVAGLLLSVAEVGTLVETGDVLAVIDDKGLKLRQLELVAEKARVEARLGFLNSEEQRLNRLAKQQNAAKTQLEQVRSDRGVAQSDLNVAIARLEQLDDQLARARLKAPFPGYVVERIAAPGERVSQGMGVVRLVNPKRIEVVARAPLDYLGFIRVSSELKITVGEQDVIGFVRALVPLGGEDAHIFEARIDIPEQHFPVGQTVRVTVPASELRQVKAVPRDALVLRPQGIAVFVIDDQGSAHRVEVITGLAQGDLIEVVGALETGDRVVVRGNERLRDGQLTSVQEPSASISSR